MIKQYSFTKLFPALLVMMFIGGCATDFSSTPQTPDDNIIKKFYEAADALIQQSALGSDEPLIVASLANINDLNGSSSFGRISSQHLASALSKSGYSVVEILLRNNVYIREGEGEFLLSRSIRNLSAQHNVQAVVVGTYATAVDNVYITTKIVRAMDSVVLASYDFTLPLGPDTKSLLRK